MFEERPFLVYDPELGRWVSTIRKQWRERQVNIWPEVKFEYRLDIRIKIKEFNFNFYYEDEFVDNLEFKWGERKSQVWWFGVERTIDSEDFKLLNKILFIDFFMRLFLIITKNIIKIVNNLIRTLKNNKFSRLLSLK